jgi:hypothetical protein
MSMEARSSTGRLAMATGADVGKIVTKEAFEEERVRLELNICHEKEAMRVMSKNQFAAQRRGAVAARAARKERRYRALGLPAEAPAPVTVRVRCDGHLHRVVFDGRHIHLPDHPNLSRDETMFEFGARCRCLEIRVAWRKRVPEVLPRPLWKAFEWRLARYQTRQDAVLARKAAAEVAAWERTRQLEHNPRTVKAVRSALEEHCHYRVSSPIPALCVRLGGGPCASGYGSRLSFRVTPGWYFTVFKAGLAVVDQRLVLAVLTEEEIGHRRLLLSLGQPVPDRWWLAALGETLDLAKGPYVLAVFQGRGYSLHERLARVVTVTGPDGSTRQVLRPCRVRKKAGPTTSGSCRPAP